MGEKEYIEREAVIKMANELYARHLAMQSHTVGNAIQDFIQSVRKAPVADVVEIVRCKDCKYYEVHKPSVTLNCERGGRLIPMMPDDFCSCGVKMDGKGEGE